MNIVEDFDLTPFNTFGINARARYFTVLENEAEIPVLFESEIFQNNEKLFLGGGSNILFTKDFAGIVVQNKLKGIEIINEDEENVWIRCMGGEVWHDLVLFALERGLWGIENLSLIPGTVGAAPMQNIGAYGAELKETLVSVEAYDLKTGEKKIFLNEDCKLGYRDSIFKGELKDKYFIFAITLLLSKKEKRNTEYKVLKNYLEDLSTSLRAGQNSKEYSLKEISEAVCAIRRSKLPDPKILGNAGSFFKNVFVSKGELERLLKEYPDMPYFEEEISSPPAQGVDPLSKSNLLERGLGGEVSWDGTPRYKIPAGWLIEECGFKGKKVGNVGMHEKQALVLVNYGGATGEELLNFANLVIKTVQEKFNLTLNPEVNLI